MFLGLPNQVSRYYGTLLKSIETKIFKPGHPPVAYYASAFALYRLESLIRKKSIDAKYRSFKFHLLAIIRIQIGGVDLPPMSSNKFEKYCEGIVNILLDEKKCISAFTTATKILDTVLVGNYDRDKAKDVSLLPSAEKICRAKIHSDGT